MLVTVTVRALCNKQICLYDRPGSKYVDQMIALKTICSQNSIIGATCFQSYHLINKFTARLVLETCSVLVAPGKKDQTERN